MSYVEKNQIVHIIRYIILLETVMQHGRFKPAAIYINTIIIYSYIMCVTYEMTTIRMQLTNILL